MVQVLGAESGTLWTTAAELEGPFIFGLHTMTKNDWGDTTHGVYDPSVYLQQHGYGRTVTRTDRRRIEKRMNQLADLRCQTSCNRPKLKANSKVRVRQRHTSQQKVINYEVRAYWCSRSVSANHHLLWSSGWRRVHCSGKIRGKLAAITSIWCSFRCCSKRSFQKIPSTIARCRLWRRTLNARDNHYHITPRCSSQFHQDIQMLGREACMH